MLLLNNSYSYYIDTSDDGVKFNRLIDYTDCYCRSWQHLRFPSRPVQYIRLVGTQSFRINICSHDACEIDQYDRYRPTRIPTTTKDITCYTGGIYQITGANLTFDVVGLQAFYKEELDLSIPTKNDCARVIAGVGGENMLNNNWEEYTYHRQCKEPSCILLQLNQPYFISSLLMLLGCDPRNQSIEYSFYIETSIDKENWQLAVDKRNESLLGWQEFEFKERPVVFIKIVGTQSGLYKVLNLVWRKKFLVFIFLNLLFSSRKSLENILFALISNVDPENSNRGNPN